MENSPATFQTLYLWLNINIPNQHIFHRKAWNMTRSSHVVYLCDFLKPVPDWEADWKTKDIKKRRRYNDVGVGEEKECRQTPWRLQGLAWSCSSLPRCDWKMPCKVPRSPLLNYGAHWDLFIWLTKRGEQNATVRKILQPGSVFNAKSLTHQLTHLQKKVSLSKPLASELGKMYGGEEGVRFNR